jgi:hypothetical protein
MIVLVNNTGKNKNINCDLSAFVTIAAGAGAAH